MLGLWLLSTLVCCPQFVNVTAYYANTILSAHCTRRSLILLTWVAGGVRGRDGSTHVWGLCVWVWGCVGMCACAWVCMCMCVYVCMCHVCACVCIFWGVYRIFRVPFIFKEINIWSIVTSHLCVFQGGRYLTRPLSPPYVGHCPHPM